MTHSLLLAAASTSGATDARLIIAAVAGVAVIIAMITWLKIHPFLALTVGSIGVGIGAGLGLNKSGVSFSNGVGSTVASVGLLVALGAMFGKLLADSGGADQIVDTIVTRSSARALPWTMALVGALIGLPMFFEIGLVLLIPVIILVARRSGLPLFRIAIPTLAGLSVMHGLVPPHPGPLVAVAALKANLGLTLALGVLVAIPTVIIAGPIFSRFAAKWVDVPVPSLFITDEAEGAAAEGRASGVATGGRGEAAVQTLPRTGVATAAGATDAVRPRPSFAVALASILLPVILMLGKAVADVVAPDSKSNVKTLLDFIGTPLIALTIAVIFGIIALGRGGQMSKDAVSATLEKSLPPIAGILLIVAAGGGFKQVLIDTGIGNVIAKAIEGSSLSVLLLAWIVAVLIRVATGSATVATVTAAGILAPVATHLTSTHISLMVLAIGSGSLFLSHVNDAGFWLVKEYMGTSVLQNFKTWTVMECIISVCGLGGVLALSTVI
jgi:gluconate:H+ symporter, GntP family